MILALTSMNRMTVEKMSMKKNKKRNIEYKMAPNWLSMKSMKSNPGSDSADLVLMFVTPRGLA